MITCFFYLILCFGFGFCQQDITPDVTISIEVPPKEYVKRFSNGTINMYVQRGSNMVLECSIFNMPTLGNIFWRKYPYKGGSASPVNINKGFTSYDLSKFRIGQGKEPYSIRLEILTVDEDYAGIYACEVMYTANVVNAKSERTLMIYDLPEITYTEFNNRVDSGKDITFSCIARGIPAPVVLWKRIGGNSNIIKNTGVVLYSNQVKLSQVTYNDAGMYACYAENEWGSVERKFALQVSHPPVITITPNGNDAFQVVGCMIQLTCVVKADPVPLSSQIVWTSSTAGSISNNDRFTTKVLQSSDQETFNILRIYPTKASDLDGVTYTCTATNDFGTGTSSVSFKTSKVPNAFITGPYPCKGLAIKSSAIFIAISLFCSVFHIRSQML